MKILIIDDDANFVRGLIGLIAEQMKDAPPMIESAATLARGIEIAQTWDADITLLDPGLPDSDSPEDSLKSIDNGDLPPPVIVITGRSKEELLRLAYKYGAMDFFEKQYLNGNLIRSIHNNYLRYRLHPRHHGRK